MRTLFHLLFLSLVLLVVGCDNPFSQEDTTPIENTTELFHADKKEKEKYTKAFQKRYPDADTFTIVSPNNVRHKVTLANHKALFHSDVNPITVINLFSSWCAPCMAQLHYLNILQDKYRDDIFVTSLLVHDTITEKSIKSLLKQQEIHYYLSISKENDFFASLIAKDLSLDKNYDIPLTVIYVNGHYYTHYEGIVPIEMIDYDIQQAKKKLKR